MGMKNLTHIFVYAAIVAIASGCNDGSSTTFNGGGTGVVVDFSSPKVGSRFIMTQFVDGKPVGSCVQFVSFTFNSSKQGAVGIIDSCTGVEILESVEPNGDLDNFHNPPDSQTFDPGVWVRLPLSGLLGD